MHQADHHDATRATYSWKGCQDVSAVILEVRFWPSDEDDASFETHGHCSRASSFILFVYWQNYSIIPNDTQ
jgi:hypothetical protein